MYRLPFDLFEEGTTDYADKILVNSEFTSKQFTKSFFRLRRQPRVCYPGVDYGQFDKAKVEEAVKKLEFFVVQDMFPTTETAQLADLYLPAAGWGEKEGTFINAERRFGVSRKVARAPGQALADFSIFRLVAEAWGCGQMFEKWKSPEAVFRLLTEVSRGQPCDISGIEGFDMRRKSRPIATVHEAGHIRAGSSRERMAPQMRQS